MTDIITKNCLSRHFNNVAMKSYMLMVWTKVFLHKPVSLVLDEDVLQPGLDDQAESEFDIFGL